jgi:hypothetical protein
MMSARSPGRVIGTLWFDAMSTNARSGRASTTASAGGSRENFLYEFKAGPAGGRLRRPSSADGTTTEIALDELLGGAFFTKKLGDYAAKKSARIPSTKHVKNLRS